MKQTLEKFNNGEGNLFLAYKIIKGMLAMAIIGLILSHAINYARFCYIHTDFTQQDNVFSQIPSIINTSTPQKINMAFTKSKHDTLQELKDNNYTPMQGTKNTLICEWDFNRYYQETKQKYKTEPWIILLLALLAYKMISYNTPVTIIDDTPEGIKTEQHIAQIKNGEEIK